MLSRRSIFSLFAGAIAAITGAKAVASTPEANAAWLEREMQNSLMEMLRGPYEIECSPLTPEMIDRFKRLSYYYDVEGHRFDPRAILEKQVADHEGRMVPLNGMSSRPYVCTSEQYEAGECLPTQKSLGMMFPRGMLVTGSGMPDMIADGNGALFMIDSPQGREVLESMAAPNAGKSRW